VLVGEVVLAAALRER